MVAAYSSDLTLDVATKLADNDSDADTLLRELYDRKQSIIVEQQRLQEWCDRADKLYYAEDWTQWGADLWANDPSANTPGRAHVSINTPPAYVDIPAALQSVEPIENILATDTSVESKQAAAALERVRYAWKRKERWTLKRQQAATAKGLYGRTAAFVYWKPADGIEKKGYPCVEIIDQPRNLYLGWKSSKYDDLLWSAYVTKMTPQAVVEEFSVVIESRVLEEKDTRVRKIVPWVRAIEPGAMDNQTSRSWLDFGEAQIEVWDYWFLQPAGKIGKRGSRTKMSVWNAVFAGGELVKYAEYPEYGGKLPIVPLFNTFIPGVPDGRPDLYDLEHPIREKYERITSGSQMIQAAVGGNYFQLVGPDAPPKVPPEAKPKLNEIAAPGPGNRIETITPWVPTVNLEQYLSRIDREMAVISGLNDLLLGLAPAQVLSSSKAINALIANYESRLAVRRSLFYQWDIDVWDLVVAIWAKKDEDIGQIVASGGGVLDITDPSLTPRDDMEAATRAINLLNAKVWTQQRAMDATGVDDPETEQDEIRRERTDATLFPADVQTQVQLLAIMQQMGLGQQAQAQAAGGTEALRQAGAAATPDNATSSQLPGDQGVLPPEAETPPPGGEQSEPMMGPPEVLAQSMIQSGETKSRILSQQTIPLGSGRRRRR
jgi:hypothetical protein